jgi:alpha-amylase/alpha-mannosidase (GH57 family)
MAEVALAFLWHQHQPYYPDDQTGENPMPWVRLHGVKDYYGMALHLLEYPEMRCTVNLVPSLLVQLQAYSERGATDQFLTVSRQPTDGLSENDCLFLLEHFFMANPEHMIRPHRRYAELYRRRGIGRNTAREALRRFHERDLRDLQVWFNLAWIHALAFERDAELRELRDKGSHFTEEEKNRLLAKHVEILRSVIPLHKQLAETGQVELTTTPYYHPLLPLILDKKLAREAMPEAKLPRYTGGYPEDAAVHVGRAVEFHTQVFGKAPRGMWPAEGSVCQTMLPLLAEHGIRWIATDEEVLGASTHGFTGRDSRGHVRNPDQMYRPYKVAEGGRELGIVFRDHALSDMIGFHYQRSEPVAAAEDFISQVRHIGQAVSGEHPALVSVILDGENCWEHYQGGGVTFLRALYKRCVKATDILPVQVGEFLDKHPPRDTLPHLFAGSWINHNFAIWIGHEEDNTAWDALHQAREHLKQRERESGERGAQGMTERETARSAPGDSRSSAFGQAWEELYIAEGSDWFWWFGDDHSSSQDAQFDYLFRKHLQNVYLLIGDTPPAELSRPISRKGQRVVHTMPRAFLDVKVNGRRTFFEWLGAGRYVSHDERGTMTMGARGPLKEIHFGFSASTLLIRVDFDYPAHAELGDYNALRIGFVEPGGFEIQVTEPGGPKPQAQLLRNGMPVTVQGPAGEPHPAVEIGIDQIVELALPFQALGLKADEPVHFYVELVQGSQSRDRAPREGTINLHCPSPDFEQIMWDV